MGLLDDAIREHLELKRRRGADPGEIAHQEQAALSPVFPPEEGDEAAAAPESELPADVAAPAVAEGAAGAVHAAQETAEIDMQAVLEGEDVEAFAAPGVRAARVLDDDALEWEMPGEGALDEGLTPEIPGQERMSFE
jgi:hypothetical protein